MSDPPSELVEISKLTAVSKELRDLDRHLSYLRSIGATHGRSGAVRKVVGIRVAHSPVA
jgi:hypothetical protein